MTGFDGAGNEVGRLDVPIGANQATRVNALFTALGVGEIIGGSIRVQASPGTRVFAEIADLDTVTSDPEYARLR